MRVFYVPDAEAENCLPEEEALHAVKVLRLRVGDEIGLVDGRGHAYAARVSAMTGKTCMYEIERELAWRGRNFRLHIAIAPTKNTDRLEWFVEKAVEIGIDEITPLVCDRSERKVVKAERLEKVAIAAMKQSLHATLPKINAPMRVSDVAKAATETQCFIAHCAEDEEKHYLKSRYEKGNSALLMIGPEGDFSPEEIETVKQAGFEAVSLGESRLRTETAGIVGCHTINIINE